MIRKIYLSIICFVWISFANAQSINEVLNQAGNNSDNLKAVLEYYKKAGEMEKYKAALFLIKNMSIHESQTYKWIDEDRNPFSYSELDYEDFDKAQEVLAKLKDSLRLRPFKYKEKDINILTSEMLINNIDLAFLEWKNNPWSSSYTFETFCEYVLPYRSLIEPLEDNWRIMFLDLLEDVKNSNSNNSDPLEVCWEVSKALKKFEFITKRKEPLPLLSPRQLLFRRQGSCPDLTNANIFAGRSLGLAVTFDFTPHYAASSNRHYWATIMDEDGNHIPFNGNIENHKLASVYDPNIKRLAKVYRKTYSIQQDALASLTEQSDIPKGFLREKNMLDVTNEYVFVGTIEYKVNSSIKDKIGFLNVFNLGKWVPVDWGEIIDTKMRFDNTGKDIVYLPSVYRNSKMIFAPYPILLDLEGNQHILTPNLLNTFDYNFSRINEKRTNYKETNTLNIEDGKTYILLYWNKGWKTHSKVIADGINVQLKNIPSNALFRLVPIKSDRFERIFIIDKKINLISWY